MTASTHISRVIMQQTAGNDHSLMVVQLIMTTTNDGARENLHCKNSTFQTNEETLELADCSQKLICINRNINTIASPNYFEQLICRGSGRYGQIA